MREDKLLVLVTSRVLLLFVVVVVIVEMDIRFHRRQR